MSINVEFSNKSLDDVIFRVYTSDVFRRNLVERMRSMCDQHDRDEKKLLADIRELDRLLENHNTSKNFLVKKSNIRQEQIQVNEFFAGKRIKKNVSLFLSFITKIIS